MIWHDLDSCKIGLHYKDIFLIPNYSEVETRKNVDTSCKLGTFTFNLPIIPANMKCVINFDTAWDLESNNYFYIMHRFSEIETYELVHNLNTHNKRFISISLGVKDSDINLLKRMKHEKYRIDCITIDIAHGHSKVMKDFISKVKDLFPSSIIVAGNIATCEAALQLIDWEVDVIKVGIGPGAACTTRLKTGFFSPMFSTILEIKQSTPSIPIIADGGIQHNGDIAKALVAGANFVMAGSMFAKLSDSPADIVKMDNQLFKEYYGSASEYNKSKHEHIEGTKVLLPMENRTYLEKMLEIKQDLQSAVSYGGGTNLSHLKNVKWGVQYE